MKNYKSTSDFYRGEDWAKCKAQVLHDRIKDGVIYCEHCGKPIVKGFNPSNNKNSGAIVFHHIIYLNNINVNQAEISINPENIMVCHWSCHNEIHQRFGYSGSNNIPEKKVYIVTGASCSGKTSWVQERLEPNDVVVDIDDLWEVTSGQPRYTKPSALKPIVFNLRDELKGLIARGAGTWRNAYIIESLPSATDRNREADKYKQFNVEVITMEATQDECLNRLHSNPSGRNINDYEKYIKEYYERYRE